MFRTATLLVLALALVPSRIAAAEQFEIGGPLAGVKLNLFPTQHGEEPGLLNGPPVFGLSLERSMIQ